MAQVIVFAAGLGSRLKEVTERVPKPLIPINGQPIIERNIECMIEAGIERAIIVVGYMSHRFLYLAEKYKGKIDVNIIMNERYREFNTLSSMYCAAPYFSDDAYVVTGDLFLRNNLYKMYRSEHNFYLHTIVDSLERPEWAATLDDNGCIVTVNKNSYSGSIYTGFSFWPKEDLNYIKARMELVDWGAIQTRGLFWDEILFPVFDKFKVHVKHCCNNDLFEVDDLEDLLRLKHQENDCTNII